MNSLRERIKGVLGGGDARQWGLRAVALTMDVCFRLDVPLSGCPLCIVLPQKLSSANSR